MSTLKMIHQKGKIKYITAAFHSGNGKTNFTMLVSILPYWKVENTGDDITWLRIEKDDQIYALDPEKKAFLLKGEELQINQIQMKLLFLKIILFPQILH
jgi:GTP-dependent phosphoenolpyruvate carboxykinase